MTNVGLTRALVTKRMTVHTMQHRGRIIHLIDTPGFGDMYRSDEDVFLESAYTLIKAYELGIRMSSIVYALSAREIDINLYLARNINILLI
jgi:hypothetical protein